jgi:ankyrin repeat protein
VAKILLEEAKTKYGPSIIRSMTHDKDDDGATPLLLGVGKGGTSIVQLLLAYKANPNHKNKENVFPVHSAARTGDLDILKLLCEVSIYHVGLLGPGALGPWGSRALGLLGPGALGPWGSWALGLLGPGALGLLVSWGFKGTKKALN